MYGLPKLHKENIPLYNQWRNEGGAKEDICLRAQHFGGAKLRSECYALITKCQLMLIITIYKMSNVIAKSHQDHQGSQSEQLWTLMTFHGGVSVSSNKRPLVVWLMAASQRFQKARVANFPTSLTFYSCVTMGRESGVHSACRVLYCACFSKSDKTYTMLLLGMCRGGMNEATPPDIQDSASSKEWNYKKHIITIL